jgi:hypothetical protein
MQTSPVYACLELLDVAKSPDNYLLAKFEQRVLVIRADSWTDAVMIIGRQ